MSDDRALVPVWALATGDVQVPPIAGNGPMTAERLAELRMRDQMVMCSAQAV
jgi:hypothetical protein